MIMWMECCFVLTGIWREMALLDFTCIVRSAEVAGSSSNSAWDSYVGQKVPWHKVSLQGTLNENNNVAHKSVLSTQPSYMNKSKIYPYWVSFCKKHTKLLLSGLCSHPEKTVTEKWVMN